MSESMPLLIGNLLNGILSLPQTTSCCGSHSPLHESRDVAFKLHAYLSIAIHVVACTVASDRNSARQLWTQVVDRVRDSRAAPGVVQTTRHEHLQRGINIH